VANRSDDSAGLVTIGQLARDAGVSSRTIRYYEELGILPQPRRSPGGTRKYPREYSGYIAAALALKDLGFRLEEVKPLARLAAGRAVSQGQRSSARSQPTGWTQPCCWRPSLG
jgi:DNA-binding transcriptional MerR regulator